MGHVLRALKRAGRADGTSADTSAVHVISKAVASATAFADEKLDEAPPSAGQAQRRPLPTPADPASPPPVADAAEPALEAPVEPARQAEHISPMVLTHHRPRCDASEQVRQLRTALIRLASRGAMRCMITSAQPREGKTVTAGNLACSFAEISHQRTLLVDADLRRGKIAGLFGLGSHAGLSELLAGESTIDQVVCGTGRPNLHVVPTGRVTLDAIGGLLSGPATEETMRELFQPYDSVIIDTPPTVNVADPGIIGRWVDLALLAVRIHRTPRRTVEQAAQLLENAGVNVAGIIALDEQAAGRKYYRYANYA